MIAIAHRVRCGRLVRACYSSSQAISALATALATAVAVADRAVRAFGAAADALSSTPRSGQDRGGPPRGRGPVPGA